MNQDQFVARRQSQWRELAQILDQMQGRGTRRLPLEMAQRLGRLYRQTASDLAYARTYYPGTDTVHYLNHLVARAHSMIYAEEPQRLRALARFFWREVPEAVRASWRWVLLAFALFALGAVVGYIGVLYDPNLAEAFVPEAVLEYIISPQARYATPMEVRAVSGTAILLNNVKVSVFAFGLGITLGLGTGAVLFYNGAIVGAVLAQAVQTGHTYSLWAHLLTHGTLELMAIFLCGGAGFVIGWSIVDPGDLPRREAVPVAARRAVKLVMGGVLFLILAATLEGWITPEPAISDEVKFLIAAITGLLALAYFTYGGRDRKPIQQT